MATGAKVLGATLAVVLLGGAGYVAADAYDVVPGLVTLEEPPPTPAPFPTAPGAVEAPAPVAALPALDEAAAKPQPARVQALVDALAADKRLGGADGVGVLVTDQLTGEVVAEHLPTRGREPASTAKLVTAVAALSSLDGSSTIPTRVVRASADVIVLVGGGDMMLGADAGNPLAVNGRAGLGDLARATAKQLRLEGRAKVAIQVDDTLFTGPKINPNWAATDLSGGFVAAVTPLAVDVAKIKPGEYPPRYPDPTMSAAKVFAQRLTAAGITVTGTPKRAQAPAGAQELAVVQSAPLADVVHYFLETSDNTITEVVSRLVAIDAGLPASFEGGTSAVLRQVAQLGVDITGAHLEDASGLAEGSTLAPRTLDGLLHQVTSPTQPALRPVAAGMPIGGLTGTLNDRYTKSTARGFVRAKTGSLKGTTALAGTVLDTDGRQLVFAVIADHTPPGGQYGPRAAIDAFVTKVQACGCSG